MDAKTFEAEFRKLVDVARETGDVMAASTDLAMDIGQEHDNAQLWLGDLALLVSTVHGQDSIGKWATDIGRVRKTITDYRTVAAFWPTADRMALMEECPTINYSLLKLAANRFATRDEATTFLIECVDQHWSVEKARMVLNKRMGRHVPAEKLIPASLVEITHLDYATGTMTVKFIGGLFPTHLSAGVRGQIVMTVAAAPVEMAEVR